MPNRVFVLQISEMNADGSDLVGNGWIISESMSKHFFELFTQEFGEAHIKAMNAVIPEKVLEATEDIIFLD